MTTCSDRILGPHNASQLHDPLEAHLFGEMECLNWHELEICAKILLASVLSFVQSSKRGTDDVSFTSIQCVMNGPCSLL